MTPRTAWHRVRHLLPAHGHDHHDTAERYDSALAGSMGTLVGTCAVLLATAAVQVAVVLLSGSVALLGDTIHNAADALTAVPIGIAFVLGRRAATSRFTYGFGRAEDLAGAVVVLVIAASAVLTGYQAVLRLVHPQPVTHVLAVAVAGLVGCAGNEVVAQWRIRVGRRVGSAALVADGLHARADGVTSLAVVLGAGGVAAGLPLADPIVGLLITVAIAFVLRDAAREVAGRLLDAVNPAYPERAARAAAAVDGVRGVADLRMRWVGHELRAELSVRLDPELTVGRAHRIAHEVETGMARAVPRLSAAVVHTEPAGIPSGP